MIPIVLILASKPEETLAKAEIPLLPRRGELVLIEGKSYRVQEVVHDLNWTADCYATVVVGEVVV